MKNEILPKFLRPIILTTILLTFLLITLGGFVHNSGNSLACPDWPLCYGQLMPPMVGGVLIEHGHRTLGALVGIFVLGILFLLDKKNKKYGWILLTMVSLQGVLGGITVLFKLPTLVSTFHLTLSLVFFCTLIYVDHQLFGKKQQFAPEKILSLKLSYRQQVIFALIMMGMQVILGAFIRHAGIGSACGLGAKSIFMCQVSQNQEWISVLWPQELLSQWNMGHRLLGIVVTLVVLSMGHRCFWNLKAISLRVYPLLISVLCLIQVGMGMSLLYFSIGEISTTLHLSLAATLVALLFKYQLVLGTVEQHLILKKLLSPYNFLIDIWEMTKPKLTFLVLITSCVGVILSPRMNEQPFSFSTFLVTLLGIYGLVAGSCAINCVMEKEADSRMDRTRLRAIPSLRINQKKGLFLGISFILFGLGMLIWKTNYFTIGLGIGASLLYLLAYTPMKMLSPMAVYIGAIPGAIPPVMGLMALAPEHNGPILWMALFLFLLLFIWQIPHFLSLSIFYKDDYKKADIKIFPLTTGTKGTILQMFLFSFLLLLIGYMPNIITQTNVLYPYISSILGIILVFYSLYGFSLLYKEEKLKRWARTYFYSTIAYLPILLGFLILFKL